MTHEGDLSTLQTLGTQLQSQQLTVQQEQVQDRYHAAVHSIQVSVLLLLKLKILAKCTATTKVFKFTIFVTC